MTEQLAFTAVIQAAADEALDRHRLRVQTWFDQLPLDKKRELSALAATPLEWHTWAALAAAAGDYQRSSLNGK
jgi:hypothetical protein